MGKNTDFCIFWVVFEEERTFFWPQFFFSFFPKNIGQNTSYMLDLDFWGNMTLHLAFNAHVYSKIGWITKIQNICDRNGLMGNFDDF